MNAKSVLKKMTPKFVLDSYHYGLAFLGAVVFGFPSKKLTVIGVTGTSGKSTTIDFISRILEESGAKVASASSIRFKIGQKEWKNELKMTMPGRFTIQRFLRQAVDAGCKYAVLEVTSEGIKQHRHKFIHFNTAVFLNLTPEHLDSHGGFENYRNAKLELFKATANTHILNMDDKNVQYFLNTPAQKIIGYGIGKSQIPNPKSQTNPKSEIQNLYAENIQTANGTITFLVNEVTFNLNLLGQFNVLNALAAISVGLSEEVSLEVSKKALEKVVSMPGRLEVVSKDPLVVVDYGFTPQQLEASYASVKQFSGGKSLVCVLGACGGGRDKWKRPVLGSIAAKECREIIITNEDPYDEDPLEIMEQVAGGIENHDYHIVIDRKEAIKKALELATPEDAIIITGKGSETSIALAGGKKIPWSDKEIVKEELARKK